MAMQVGIYSPRPPLLEQTRAALEGFCRTAYLDVRIHSFDSRQALSAGVTEIPLDLLFYDMEEDPDPEADIKRLAGALPFCSMVLLCGDARHALAGYAVKAIDYLLTPVHSEDLIDVLAHFLRERLSAGERYLPLKLNGVWTRLDMRHITYIESAGHALIFHMSDGRSFRSIAHYRDYEGLLDMDPDFLRCHKSYVVNMRYVTGWNVDSLTLADGSLVNVSRPYRQTVRTFYACYVTQTADPPPPQGAEDGR